LESPVKADGHVLQPLRLHPCDCTPAIAPLPAQAAPL
jgi:hypothetical protein